MQSTGLSHVQLYMLLRASLFVCFICFFDVQKSNVSGSISYALSLNTVAKIPQCATDTFYSVNRVVGKMF